MNYRIQTFVCQQKSNKFFEHFFGKELIINFLCGLITTAEKAFEEGGKGAEKLKMVEEAFNKTAPWFLKILLASAGVGSLQELIEIALKRLKKTWNTDPKDPEEPKEEEEK